MEWKDAQKGVIEILCPYCAGLLGQRDEDEPACKGKYLTGWWFQCPHCHGELVSHGDEVFKAIVGPCKERPNDDERG